MTEDRRLSAATQAETRRRRRALALERLRARALTRGWIWGQVLVAPAFQVDRPNGRYHVIDVNDLTIYVSPAGYTRVFRHNKELKTDAHRKADQARTEGSPRSGADEGEATSPAEHPAGHDGGEQGAG